MATESSKFNCRVYVTRHGNSVLLGLCRIPNSIIVGDSNILIIYDYKPEIDPQFISNESLLREPTVIKVHQFIVQQNIFHMIQPYHFILLTNEEDVIFLTDFEFV